MKFKISVVVIILSTVCLIGAVYLMVNKITGVPDDSLIGKQRNEPENKSDKNEAVFMDENDEDDELEVVREGLRSEKTENKEINLSDQDRQKIADVVKLTDAQLDQEIEMLKKRIEADEIFDDLEEGNLSKEEEIKAKEILERFALLGLEKNRRKYIDIDPELKDAMYAHRESFKDIREVLDEE